VSQDRERVQGAFGLLEPGYEHRHILRSAQWGLAAMPAPISFGASVSFHLRSNFAAAFLGVQLQ
jgi:hypothetical protein